tara:strand:+ start:2611 stop:4479 length:1869 start_codon:yes stop_codon:yes gene_type:complete
MSLLNPVERENYVIGSVVKGATKVLTDYFQKASNEKVSKKALMDQADRIFEDLNNTPANVKLSDAKKNIAKKENLSVSYVNDIDKFYREKAGGGSTKNAREELGKAYATTKTMIKEKVTGKSQRTKGQEIQKEIGADDTLAAREKGIKYSAVTLPVGITVGAGATLTAQQFLSGLSSSAETKVKENKSGSVTDITSGTMDDAFSKASKNPTKYVFIKQGQPHFMYKGQAVPFALATEESDIVLDMVPREKNTKGSLMRRNEERPVPGFAPISNTDRKEYFQLQDALQDGSKTPEELTQADRDLIKMVEAVLEAERQERERKVNGGITVEDRINNAAMLLEEGKINNREAATMAAKTLSLATSQKELDRLKFQIKYKFATGGEDSSELGFIPKDIKNKIDNFKLGDSSYKTFEENRNSKAKGGKFPDLTGDGEVTQADVLKGRGVFNEGGSLLLPPELQETPVDTYTPEDQANAEATQVSDDMMEEEYVDYIINESLNDDEQNYLAEALTNDPRLSDIMDKVFVTASEFTGSGEVEGPGTGVSDSIPARLSDGEFVMTRKATDQIGADNLQRMMDDAERAYDGGLQSMAVGGMVEDEDPEKMSQTDEEIRKLMMGSNQIPSLR